MSDRAEVVVCRSNSGSIPVEPVMLFTAPFSLYPYVTVSAPCVLSRAGRRHYRRRPVDAAPDFEGRSVRGIVGVIGSSPVSG